jgi:hypothetical protein
MVARFFLFIVLVLTCGYVFAQDSANGVYPGANLDPKVDYRYCGPPKRNAKGEIIRSSSVLKKFQEIHPCPSTQLTVGACPGWAKNHDVSLACGGCDAVFNISWIPVDTKACAGPHCVDRYERKINALSPPVPDTAACVNELVP